MALDLSSSPTPPPPTTGRGRAPGAGTPGRKTGSAIKDARIERRTQAVVDLCQLAYGGLAMAEQYADAGAIALHGMALSNELANLAEDNKSVADAIDKLSQASPYAGLVMVFFRLGSQLAANHGLIKAEKAQALGGKEPQTLAQETKAKVKADAIAQARQAREMEREAAEMARLYEEELAMDRAESAAQNGDGGS